MTEVVIDPHVLTAIWFVLAAGGVAGGLIIWLAIELEMKRKK